MSLNSLFFNYDKLAKDGVVETIDWRNPPDSDDDNTHDVHCYIQRNSCDISNVHYA